MGWKEHLPIRKCPFSADEDPTEFMISRILSEAEAEGWKLTEGQRERLRREASQGEADAFEQRVRGLVEAIITKEREANEGQNPRSFVGAIEWAGDGQYPLVVQIAEGVLCENPGLSPPLRGWSKTKDALLCFGCGVVIVVAMVLIVGLLGLFGLMD